MNLPNTFILSAYLLVLFNMFSHCHRLIMWIVMAACLTASLDFLFSEVKRFETRTDHHGLCLRDGFHAPGFEYGTGSGIVTFNPMGSQCHEEGSSVKHINLKKLANSHPEL